MPEPRKLSLRRADACASCAAALVIGADAWWHAERRLVTCLICKDLPADAGVAGASAQAIFDRKVKQREDRVKARFPRIGKVVLAVTTPPQQTTAWAKGAAGERAVGAMLDSIPGTKTLHDRRRPGSKANIDHLVVTPTGVWVVDAKRYSGTLGAMDKGGWFSSDERLIVAGRDQTKLADAVFKQMQAVRQHADAVLQEFSAGVFGALCFSGAEWGLLQRSFVVKGVVVAAPKHLAKRLAESGPLQPDGVRLLANGLAKIFGQA